MIYLASPYSHEDHDVVVARFDAVCHVSAKLMSKGVQLFCPIAHTHPIAVAGELPRGWDFWQTFDHWFVSNCDEVWVLMLDGWECSKGVRAEIEMALEMGKVVRYLTSDGDQYDNFYDE